MEKKTHSATGAAAPATAAGCCLAPPKMLGSLATYEIEASHNSTCDDLQDMERMGRKQELVRNFRLLSMISFVALATAAWELAIFSISPALVDGGLPNLIYSSIWCFLGFGPVYLSMSEMASMAPIAGAQYHWVSEFAPARLQKTLSYFTGYVKWHFSHSLPHSPCTTSRG